MLAAPRIAHEDGAVFPGRKYTQSQNEVARDVGRPVAPVIPTWVAQSPRSGKLQMVVVSGVKVGANF